MYKVLINDVSDYIKAISIANEQDDTDKNFRPKELLFRGLNWRKA